MLSVPKLLSGDSIGVIAPSRPIWNYKNEIMSGISALEQRGFIVKKGKHLDEKQYYSAGTVEQRIQDIHGMLNDPDVKAIVFATGGMSSNQLLGHIDFSLLSSHPKILIGYSDLTNILVAAYAATGLTTFYGPTAYELSLLTSEAYASFFDLLEGRNTLPPFPTRGEVWRSGSTEGILVGGHLMMLQGLLPTKFMPDLSEKIFFWETAGVSPAMIDFELQGLRLAGVFDKICGMVIGHLSNCVDKKYPMDNRPIRDIVLEKTDGYDFPIIKVDYFGHDIDSFFSIPIGARAVIDTEEKVFSLITLEN